jgi:hypothetical protein
VIGTGEQSQFGEVFKMMRAEEVKAAGLWEGRGGFRAAGAVRLRGCRGVFGEAEEEGSRAEGGQPQLPPDLF